MSSTSLDWLRTGFAAGIMLLVLPLATWAALEQIQLSLGQASIQTTERYLGVRQDLHDAPCDRLGLDVGGPEGPSRSGLGGPSRQTG